VTTGLCDPWQLDCWDAATQRRRICRFTPTPFSLAGAQAIIITQAVIKPVYIIHQESDLPKKGLSTTNKVVIGVVVPVVIILAIVIGGVIVLRRAKARKGRNRNQYSYSVYRCQMKFKRVTVIITRSRKQLGGSGIWCRLRGRIKEEQVRRASLSTRASDCEAARLCAEVCVRTHFYSCAGAYVDLMTACMSFSEQPSDRFD